MDRVMEFDGDIIITELILHFHHQSVVLCGTSAFATVIPKTLYRMQEQSL